MNTKLLYALPLLVLLAQGCTENPAAPAAAIAAPAAPAAPAADPLVFDTWVPGPCSPNGQPQGQCPPGERFRVRLVPVAEGLTNPRHVSFMPNGDFLIAELANRVRVVRGGKLASAPLAGWPAAGLESTS